MEANLMDDLESQARTSLSLFSFGDVGEYTLLSQSTTSASKLRLEERVVKRGGETTLYLVRSTVFVAAELHELLPILINSEKTAMNDAVQFFFGGKHRHCTQVYRQKRDTGVASLKRVIADQGTILKSRWQCSFLDFEGTLVPDWRDDYASQPKPDMFVRVMQSSSLLDDPPTHPLPANTKLKSISPRGVMVRKVPNPSLNPSDAPLGVEVQFVVSFLETALINLPRRSRYQKLVAQMAKLEDVVVSRRLSRTFRDRKLNPLHPQIQNWVANDNRTTCHICNAKFHFSKRRHHCRLCGEIACDACSPKMEVWLPYKSAPTAVRICTDCVHAQQADDDEDVATATLAKSKNVNVSVFDTIYDAMYCNNQSFKDRPIERDLRGTASSSPSSSSELGDDVAESVSLLDLNLHLAPPLDEKGDACKCCRDLLGAVRYGCSMCTGVVCGSCNLQVHGNDGVENLCRICVGKDSVTQLLTRSDKGLRHSINVGGLDGRRRSSSSNAVLSQSARPHRSRLSSVFSHSDPSRHLTSSPPTSWVTS
ncbi:hypothetical protein SDRG_02785 [Saprolegnia diclina VS20]|uniref:FYVE-type domain-containing protein n=1 Tax=Saprolegnia diclina (strain VS20) TaxID=1156394 RepID=T0R1E2_SAPDV|nr:hypothetical protein SDRG_02785 [Saprolegnia diclina VS20]EQC40135.1 hypothetical protein SDRG_02785 [Saprolegnia diclina VS20]|eukprot:XP_008606609.1 hypothetical protein SDRG_02785 [Saprolegnia diclina VS20]